VVEGRWAANSSRAVTASGASTRDAACGDRHTDLGLLTEWLEVRDVTGGRVTFDAHSVFPDGDDRVSTSALCFRDADTLREALTTPPSTTSRSVMGGPVRWPRTPPA
jgi:hypothetical protein